MENPVTREHFTIARSGPEALLLEVRVPPDMIRPPQIPTTEYPDSEYL